MPEIFYTILTNVGKAKIANATILNQKVNFKTIAVGDSGGSYYEPTETQTVLKNEVWRGEVGSIAIDEQNSNWVIVESVIPPSVGGFMVREVALLDDEGDMLAIGKYPETYKPTANDGTVKDLIVRLILEIANTQTVTLKIDPSVVLATKKDVFNMGKTKADLIHNHNDLYHTKDEISMLLDNKLDNTSILSVPIILVDRRFKKRDYYSNSFIKKGNVVQASIAIDVIETIPKPNSYDNITIFEIPEGFKPLTWFSVRMAGNNDTKVGMVEAFIDGVKFFHHEEVHVGAGLIFNLIYLTN